MWSTNLFLLEPWTMMYLEMLNLGLRYLTETYGYSCGELVLVEASSLLPYKTGGRSTGMVRLLQPVVAALYLLGT